MPSTGSVTQWFVVRDKRKLGPFAWTQLQEQAASGQLSAADMVLPAGTTTWLPASSVPGLVRESNKTVGGNPVAETLPAQSGGDTQAAQPATVSFTEPEAKALPVPIPVNIAGYEILEKLGHGGMGVVYKARHLKLKRIVALKMILGGVHGGATALARFQTEAEAIASLHHPNIVQLYDHGQHEGLPYFTLEYISGGSLADKVRDATLPPNEAAHIVQQLAEGMAYAHGRGILHRDLKPGNVLLAISDQHAAISQKDKHSRGTVTAESCPLKAIPKITDFGLAKRLDADAEMTATGSVMGTPGYMAPEQAAGKKLGPGADIYALGAILYRLLTGRPPFQAATLQDFVLQVQVDDPVPPSKLVAKLPRDLETICLKCLAKERERRYPDAEALSDDLRRFREGEPIFARPIGSLQRLWRWCKRKPGLAAASTAAAFGLLLAMATFAVAYFVVSESRDKAINLNHRA